MLHTVRITCFKEKKNQFLILLFFNKFLSTQVTDELPAGPRKVADPKATMIKVQPLKRSEMQVSKKTFIRPYTSYLIFFSRYMILAFLCSRSWNRRSHPWNLWITFARIRYHRRILWFYPLLSFPQPIPQCTTRFV